MNRKLLKISKLTISLCLFNLHAFAFNYDIVFTASGAATTVGDVVVQNTSLGTSITIPAGNVLRLTDGVSAIDALNQNNFSNLEVFTNAASGLASISFYANQTGNANVSIYGLNGTKIAELTQHLNEGTNSFDLSLYKGVFLVQVAANTYNYTAKVLIQNEMQKKKSP